MKTLEQYVGVELFDRSRKPVQLSQTVLDQRERVQELASGLRRLLHDLRRQDRQSHNRIVIAGQHSLSTVLAPALVKRLSDDTDLNISLRLTDRHDCYTLLLTRQVDFALAYQADGVPLPSSLEFFDHCLIGSERVIPVCGRAIRQQVQRDFAQGRINSVAYPPASFLGRVVNQWVLPALPSATSVHNRVESAVTLAVAQFAMSGLGVAWIPISVVSAELDTGALVDLSDFLPTTEMRVVGGRLVGPLGEAEQRAWDVMRVMRYDRDALVSTSLA